jgi:transposase
LEAELLPLEWQKAKEGVDVKLLALKGELYVLARSNDRVAKERAMRRRQLKKLWARLKELQRMAPARDTLLLKLGAAKSQYPSAWRLVKIELGQDGELSFCLRKDKLRQTRQREGRYLLRSNLGSENPARLWQLYVLLTQIEEAFKNLKGDLALRPIFHQLEKRIEAHIFVAFLACCLPGFLPPRNFTSPIAPQSSWTHASIGFGTTLGYPNARRPLPNHRRTLAYLL